MSDLQNYVQKTNFKSRCVFNPGLFPGSTAGSRNIGREALRTVQSMREREREVCVRAGLHKSQAPGRLHFVQRCLAFSENLLNLYHILCTVNTQHTSRQDAIITIKLYLATCFGRKRPSSGKLRTILTLWRRIFFLILAHPVYKM